MYPQSTVDVPQAEKTLLAVAKASNNYWQPIKTWTTISLIISQNGLVLSTIAVSMLIVLLIFNVIFNRNHKSSLLKMYYKLPKQNQLLVTAVANAQKQGNPTTNGIATELEKLTNTQTDRESLKEQLQNAENEGLIEKTLVNREDRASFAWRNLLTTRNIFKRFN